MNCRELGLISEGHFDGHDVLFADSREALTLFYENAKLLIAGYNSFADENGKDPIDVEGIERGPGRKTDQLLNEWVMWAEAAISRKSTRETIATRLMENAPTIAIAIVVFRGA